MSTAAIPGDFSNTVHGNSMLPDFSMSAQPTRPGSRRGAPVRRRANPQQGRALETVGHGIEYLVDSRLFLTSGLDDRAEQEAIQIMMRASRAVFADCAEIVPLRRQLGQWFEKRLPWNA